MATSFDNDINFILIDDKTDVVTNSPHVESLSPLPVAQDQPLSPTTPFSTTPFSTTLKEAQQAAPLSSQPEEVASVDFDNEESKTATRDRSVSDRDTPDHSIESGDEKFEIDTPDHSIDTPDHSIDTPDHSIESGDETFEIDTPDHSIESDDETFDTGQTSEEEKLQIHLQVISIQFVEIYVISAIKQHQMVPDVFIYFLCCLIGFLMGLLIS